MFCADRFVEKFLSSSECQLGGSRCDSRSLKRLQQAQRADALLPLCRKERFRAVCAAATPSTPVAKPTMVKLECLSVEKIYSALSGHSAPAEPSSSLDDGMPAVEDICGDNTGTVNNDGSHRMNDDNAPASAVVRRQRKRKADYSPDAQWTCTPETGVGQCANSKKHDNSNSVTRESIAVSIAKSRILPSTSASVPTKCGSNMETSVSQCVTSVPRSDSLSASAAPGGGPKQNDAETVSCSVVKEVKEPETVEVQPDVSTPVSLSSVGSTPAATETDQFVVPFGSHETEWQRNTSMMNNGVCDGGGGEDGSLWNHSVRKRPYGPPRRRGTSRIDSANNEPDVITG